MTTGMSASARSTSGALSVSRQRETLQKADRSQILYLLPPRQMPMLSPRMLLVLQCQMLRPLQATVAAFARATSGISSRVSSPIPQRASTMSSRDCADTCAGVVKSVARPGLRSSMPIGKPT